MGYYLVYAVPKEDYAIEMPSLKEPLLKCSHRRNKFIPPEIFNADIPQDGNMWQFAAKMGSVVGGITRDIGIDIRLIKLLDDEPEDSSIFPVESYNRKLIAVSVYMLSCF